MNFTKRAISTVISVLVLCSMFCMNAFAESNNEIKVYFSLKGDDAHGENGTHDQYFYWVEYEENTLPKGATALELFEQSMKENGIKYDYSKGYVSSVTDYDGTKLAEMTNGPRSGWMYTVNGKFTDSMDKVILNDGDRMTFFYTDDYNTIDWNGTPESVEDVIKLINSIGTVTSDSKSKIDAAKKAFDNLSDEQKELVDNYNILEYAEFEYAELAEKDAIQHQLKDVLDKTAEYLIKNTSFDVGSIGGDWSVFGLARADKLDDTHKAKYAANVEKALKNAGSETLNKNKSTENSRVVLALTAAGFDASDFAGYDLTKPLCNYDFAVKQGVNGPVFALLALDSADYAKDNTSIREKYVKFIISQQLENGGYSYDGKTVDVDLTAMVIQALAKYRDDEKVAESVTKSSLALYNLQKDNGGFESYGKECSESTAQVMTAFLEYINDEDEVSIAEFTDMKDAIMAFYNENGGFGHDSTEINMLATEQCFYALTGLYRKSNNDTSLYDMSDVELEVYGSTSEKNDSENDNGKSDKNSSSKNDTSANDNGKKSESTADEQSGGSNDNSEDNPETGAVGGVSIAFAMMAAATAFAARKRKSY